MQNFRSIGLKTKKFIIRGILETDNVFRQRKWLTLNGGFQNTRNNKLFCFQPEWPEILHVVIIRNLSTFIFYKIFCAGKFLLMKLFQFRSRNRFLKIHRSDNWIAPDLMTLTHTYEVQAFWWWQRKFISGQQKYPNWAK